MVLPNNFDPVGETDSTQFLKSLNARVSSRPLYRMTRRAVGSEVGELKVVDSVDLNEAALVEMTADQARELAHHYPSLRVVKEVRLAPQRARPLMSTLKQPRLPRTNPVKILEVTVRSSASGNPVPGAEVTVVLDERHGRGIGQLITDAKGKISTPLPNAAKSIDAIVAVPKAGFWPAESLTVQVQPNGNTNAEIEVVPIKANHQDGLDKIGSTGPTKGAGVRIAIIDAGTDAVDGFNIVGGKNTTGLEVVQRWEDNGSGHGTHVAGIIHRIAPEAELMIYRVFAQDGESAGEIAISKAIRDAVDEGCDLINLSLGQDTEALSISRETRRARQLGTVCIAAAGNDYMSSVLYPARSSHVLSVSACGWDGSWPKGASTHRYIAPAPKAKGNVFFATFSNVGNEIDFIAPGVGTISKVSKTEDGVMDGTSMACPAITGKIASLLANEPALLAADRNQQRSDDIIKLAFGGAKPFGFGPEYEGSGYIK